jgi:hypothetical protein
MRHPGGIDLASTDRPPAPDGEKAGQALCQQRRQAQGTRSRRHNSLPLLGKAMRGNPAPCARPRRKRARDPHPVDAKRSSAGEKPIQAASQRTRRNMAARDGPGTRSAPFIDALASALVHRAKMGHNPSLWATKPGHAGRVGKLLRRLLKSWVSARLLKKVQIQGAITDPDGWVPAEARGVLCPYVAAPRERGNAVDGPFSAAC